MSGRPRSALWQLTRARSLVFWREPEALFWVFVFPILLALALGIAFRNPGPQRLPVGVERGPATAATARALAASPELRVDLLEAGAARVALRRGRIAVLVRGGPDAPVLVFDPTRPETRLARLLASEALQRAAGRRDPLPVRDDTRVPPGGRYIDFLLPGLIGLNLMGTGMWGLGYQIAAARQQKLLKRMVATPMRRSDFLLSSALARLLWLVPEMLAILLFGALVFGVQVRGSWLALGTVALAGALAFSALGLLTASRVRTIEGASGLMNFVQLPMWVLSGTFFSADRFPAYLQPFVQALPLTIVNNGLRAVVNEGAGLAAVTGPLLLLVLWGLVSFLLALRLFRWE